MEKKEAMKILKDFHDKSALFSVRTALDTIIPELCESEDERIRKEIEQLIQCMHDVDPRKKRWIAWIEKQGEMSVNKLQVSEELYEHIRNTCACIDDALSSETLADIKDYLSMAERSANNVFDMIEKQDNLKSDEWKEGDVVRHGGVLALVTNGRRAIKSNLEQITIQYPDEWVKAETKERKYFFDELEKQGEQPRYSIGDVLCDKSCTTLNKDTQPNFEIIDIRDGMYICDKGSFPISQQDKYELVAKKIDQKPVKVPKFKVGDFIQFNGMGHYRYTIKDVCGLSHYINSFDRRMDMAYTDNNFELVEQKTTNKHKPKFQNGQWIVWQNKCYKVNDNGCGYELIDQNGLSTSLEYGTIDKSAHLWTIQDVKPDDVLVVNWDNGYKLDDKKKELKKLSQRMISAEAKEALYDKPTDEEMKELLRTEYEKGRADTIAETEKEWSEEDEDAIGMAIIALEDMYDEDAPNTTYGGYNLPFNKAAERLKYLKDRAIPQPKHEWGIEDEKVIAIINNALTDSNTQPDDYDKVYDWLVSLRQRIGG